MKSILLFTFFICINSFKQTDKYAQAKKDYNEKQYNSAIEICSDELTKLNSKDSSYTKFMSVRVDCYLQLGEYMLGIKDYLTLISINPNNIYLHIGLAYMYGSINEYQKCFDALNKAYKLDPKKVIVFTNFSYYSNQANKFNDGVKYANEGLKYATSPMDVGMLLNNRGYSYIGLGNYLTALKDINKSIEVYPENSFAYCYRAYAHIQLKQMETVCDDLNKAKNLGAVNLTKDLIKENCAN